MDLKSDSNGGYDIDLTDGELSLVTGGEAIAQDIVMALRTFLGESVYDRNAGVPWVQIIFEKNTPLFVVEQILRNQILARPGVISIQSFQQTLDPITRVYTAQCNVFTSAGELNIDFGTSL